MPATIRAATPEDAEAITDIWRQGLTIAMGFEPPPRDFVAAFRQRLVESDDTFKFFVAKDGDEIVGWVSLTPFRANPVVRDYMAELSAYVRTDRIRGGLARDLLVHTLAHARKTPLQYVNCFISSTNRPALMTGAAVGFKQVGTLPESPRSPAPPLCYLTYVVPTDD